MHRSLPFIPFSCLILSLLCLVGCTTQTLPAEKNPVASKSQLKNASSTETDKLAVSMMRAQALRETALSVGARGGLSNRAQQLNHLMSQQDALLSRVFQFYGMILDDNVLPPVLIEAQNSLTLTGDDIIRVADRNFEIIQQAKFVTSAPTWRDYLWMAYHAPDLPDKSLLPRNRAESSIWERYIDEGWEAGMGQADLIFNENLNRLRRDYMGMILYRKLLMQNMVSPPYVATLALGITGDANNMNVNERVLRITAFPSLQQDGAQWKTEVRLNE